MAQTNDLWQKFDDEVDVGEDGSNVYLKSLIYLLIIFVWPGFMQKIIVGSLNCNRMCLEVTVAGLAKETNCVITCTAQM